MKTSIKSGLRLNFSVAVFLILTLVPIALAHTGASGIVKERMDAMKLMGAAMKAAAGALASGPAYDAAIIEASAKVLGNHAAKMVSLFPDTAMSRGSKASEAAPAIWEKQDEFLALATKLSDESSKLAETADSGDQSAVKAQFQVVGGVCKACHEQFRIKKN